MYWSFSEKSWKSYGGVDNSTDRHWWNAWSWVRANGTFSDDFLGHLGLCQDAMLKHCHSPGSFILGN